MSHAQIETLTDSLKSDIARMNQEIGGWVKNKENQLNSLQDNFQIDLEEAEATISSLKMNHERLDQICDQNREIKVNQMKEISQFEDRLVDFKHQAETLK